MGTTRTMLDAGSSRFVWVAAIEGYQYLLTSGSTTAAVTAWAGTDWSAALGGLFVEHTQTQELNPDDPFASSGGSCTLYVVQTSTGDTFGVDVARRTAGAETYLDATADRDDTTITVKSTASFASSGTIHIGTEAIAYTAKTGTSFTGCTRGKYSPATTESGARFSHHHRVGLDQQSVKLQPVVSAQPRQWVGRWVEVWAHREVGGVLDVKAQAELIFAGRISEIRDDPNSTATVIGLRPLLDVLKDAVVGSTMWEAQVADGIYMVAGDAFGMYDNAVDTTTGQDARTANALTVVSGTPSGTNQMGQGWYTLGELCDRLSEWLAAESIAGRINGSYWMASPVPTPQGLRTKIYWTLVADLYAWAITMPSRVAEFFGFTEGTTDGTGQFSCGSNGTGGDTAAHYYQNDPPMRVLASVRGESSSRLQTTTTTGTIADQYGTMPASVGVIQSGSENWGLFLIGDSRLVVAAFDDDTGLYWIQPAFLGVSVANATQSIKLPVDDPNHLVIRQIYAFEGATATLLAQLIASTGTASFNSSTYDVLPLGVGVAIPYSYLSYLIYFLIQGSALTGGGLNGIPGSGGPIATIIEKPTKFSELVASDLILRWAFPVWRNGGLTFSAWKSPTASLAGATLAEENKAEPSGNVTSQRSASTMTDQWQRSLVKVRYNRDAADPRSDSYHNTVMFEDRVAVDDAGGDARIRTMSLRNTYKEFGGTGQSVEALLPAHMALMPLISRPANIVRRSIDVRYFQSISVGDVVLFSDEFARDPETGARGITDRPALVVRHHYSYGGLTPGSDTPASVVGEVDLFFTDINTDRLSPGYVPSADVDDSAILGGWDSGYNATTYTLRTKAHNYSESTESADAANFPAAFKVLIVERDPLDPTAPVYWERTVSSQSGGDIVLTAALSSPAWDNTKKYRVLFQDWDTATATQHDKAYQADDVDGLILDDGQPFLYGSGSADATYTANTSTDVELVPDMTVAEGFGRDVGHEVAIVRLLDNLVDYKTAAQQPMLFNSIVGNSTQTTGYLLVAYWPVFLSYEILTNAVYRYLTVAPMARSSDGTSTSLKLSLCRDRPTATSLVNFAPTGVYQTISWTGITSTSMAALSDGILTANVKTPNTGVAFLCLELGYKCQTYGLAKFIEGVRQVQ